MHMRAYACICALKLLTYIYTVAPCTRQSNILHNNIISPQPPASSRHQPTLTMGKKKAGGFTWIQGNKKKKYNEKQGEKLAKKMAKGKASLQPNPNIGRPRHPRYLQPDSEEWADIDEMNAHNELDLMPEGPVNLLRIRPRRDAAQRRKNAAQNWLKTEERVCKILSGVEILQGCQCLLGSQAARPRRFISFERYEVRNVSLCGCGFGLQQIVQDGYFPSTPTSPETFFSTHLLRTLIEMSNLGSISRTAFAEGLRLTLSRRYQVSLPSFVGLLRDAHHHFMSTVTKFELSVDSELTQKMEDGTTYMRTSYRNSSPPCFKIGRAHV